MRVSYYGSTGSARSASWLATSRPGPAAPVDIGCGVCAVPLARLHRDDLSERQLRRIRSRIKAFIPMGFHEHGVALLGAAVRMEELCHEYRPTSWLATQVEAEGSKAAKQLGTLGGGNHFLEARPFVVYDEGGQVRAMLHSGSRAAGNKTAQHYDRQAAHWLAHHGLSARGGFNHMPTDSEFTTGAMEGQRGVIPGSMETGSYFTRGCGDPRSWLSCSNGADRRMCHTRAASDTTQAYKDLEDVMPLQSRLIGVEHWFLPLITVKGSDRPGSGDNNGRKQSKRERRTHHWSS
eukprot:jgi/Tetstr1/431988/TSEL_021465.t1